MNKRELLALISAVAILSLLLVELTERTVEQRVVHRDAENREIVEAERSAAK